MNLPNQLETVTMSELYDSAYMPKTPLIEGLLYQGAYLFVGAPKLGKSFFMLQLAYHVSTGTPLWEYPVRQGDVLYLALEDDYPRLQNRLYRMFGTDCTPHLFMTTSSNHYGYGLLEQIQLFINDHPFTSLVIVDTLQMVREDNSDRYSYGGDYEIIKEMKEFADSNRICLMLVHHTRKQQADDKFDMISGTNGLLGAADGAFILHKEKRTENKALLEISGRDQPDQRIHLTRDLETLAWTLDHADVNYYTPKPEPILEAVAKFITSENPYWSGTATELISVLGVDIPVNSITKRLNVNAGRLYNDYSILYEFSRSNGNRNLEFQLIQ